MPHDMIIDRLRAALRAVGIPATEADFAGIIEKGFLARFPDVERLLDAVDQEQLPDMLDAASLPPASSPPNGGIPADDDPTTILGIATQLQRRTISPVELVEQALERIATHDADLNVFQIVMAESALADARAAETELATGKIRGPLHGVPVAVKDLFDVAGYPTAAGSRIRADVMATTDASGCVPPVPSLSARPVCRSLLTRPARTMPITDQPPILTTGNVTVVGAVVAVESPQQPGWYLPLSAPIPAARSGFRLLTVGLSV